MGGGVPRESGFEIQWDLIAGVPQDWIKQTSLLEGTHKVSAHQDLREKSSDHIRE